MTAEQIIARIKGEIERREKWATEFGADGKTELAAHHQRIANAFSVFLFEIEEEEV